MPRMNFGYFSSLVFALIGFSSTLSFADNFLKTEMRINSSHYVIKDGEAVLEESVRFHGEAMISEDSCQLKVEGTSYDCYVEKRIQKKKVSLVKKVIFGSRSFKEEEEPVFTVKVSSDAFLALLTYGAGSERLREELPLRDIALFSVTQKLGDHGRLEWSTSSGVFDVPLISDPYDQSFREVFIHVRHRVIR